MQVGARLRTLPPAQETVVRRQGGGLYNHALFWKIMAPGNANTSTSAISANLSAAIADSFGSLDAMKADLTAAANGVFGSGWAWLAMPTDRSGRGDGSLVITATPNQDNPLMKVVSRSPQIPILGLDVWEHAYYLQYFTARANYTSAWWGVVNWQQVSRNYEHARRGEAGAIGALF